MKRTFVLGLSLLGLLGVAACSSGGGGGGFADGGGASGGFGNFGGSGAAGGGFDGGAASGGFGATGATGGFGATGATGGFGATGATGATGGFGATGATGGFGATGGGGTGGGGQTCDEAADCGNTSTMVCDPTTAQCSTAQCSDTQSCVSGKTCVVQTDGVTIGACYPACIFKGTPCSGGATCVAGTDGTDGFCWASGTASEGQTCTTTALKTGCANGLLCATDQGASVCRKQCSFWSGVPGCNSGQNCAVNGVCFAEAGDPAALGAPCSASATAGSPCGASGGAWRGLCPGPSQNCAKACRGGVTGDCTTGTCNTTVTGELGVCM